MDAVYMTATQAMTGQGGWPMTVFATPDGVPFYAGTYYPAADVHAPGPGGGRGVAGRSATRWCSRAPRSSRRSRRPRAGGLETGPADRRSCSTRPPRGCARRYDQTYGGFGGAPKFPPHLALLFLLRHHQRTGDAVRSEMVRAHRRGDGPRRHLRPARRRLRPLQRRRALAGAALREDVVRQRSPAARVHPAVAADRGRAGPAGRAETAAFLVRDLRTPQGGFASSLDADTDGEEGLTYVWTPAELAEALGPDDGAWAADLFEVTRGRHLRARAQRAAAGPRPRRAPSRAGPAALARGPGPAAAWPGTRDRSRRRDDKVVAAWTGLAVTALAEFAALTGRATGRSRGGRGRPTCSAERPRPATAGCGGCRATASPVTPAGVLDDYGCLAEAFCAVHQLTGERRWLTRAGELLDAALAHFADGRGGFYDTADDAERLVARPADPTDNATPSGLSSLAAALVELLGADRRDRATGRRRERALETVAAVVAGHPRFAGYAAADGRGPAQRPVRDRDRDRRSGRRPLVADRPPARPARRGRRRRRARRRRRSRCWPTGR